METSLASFVKSFLHCVLGEPASQQQLDLFLAVARRGECMIKNGGVGAGAADTRWGFRM